MKKILFFILALILTTSFYGCSEESQSKPDNTGKDGTEQTTSGEFIPTIGGIKRSDSRSEVEQAFGKDYKETTFEDDYSLGEPFVKLAYDNGVTVVIGSDSGKVLEIDTTSPETSTNLGYKVGDSAKAVLEDYRSKYEEPESRQGAGKLAGWFLIKDQELVIFNFDNSGQLVNQEIKEDAKIERIKISNFDYMD